MIADIYQLSPIQAGMIFRHVFAPDSTAYFDQFSCRLTGPIDPERLRRAWQAMVDRHPIFRTSFHWEGLDNPVQVVHQQATLPWESLDWRAMTPDAQAARWHARLEADRARGFDPGVPPLMRAAIARLDEHTWHFCWSHHHLLLDGWCLSLVLSELFTRYECLTEGRVPQLAPVRPYAEYIKWLQQRDRQALEHFWRENLRGFDAPTPLPASEVAADSAGVASIERRLTAALTDALRSLAARHRLTLNTLIHGAWALLLHRYSGNADVVFGATVSGRPPEVPGIETMLGVFINTVPVRARIDGSARAADWLADLQTRHVARESFAAIALSDIQKLSDVESGTPLFDTNVIVMNYRMDDRLAAGAAGLAIDEVRVFDQTDIPLTLQVTPGPRLSLEIVYDSARFDAGTVSRMLGHVEFLLSQFTDGLDRPLDGFQVVTAPELAQLFDEFNATAAPLDRATTAIDLWEQRVAETPDAIALECDEVRLTCRELNAWANRLARGLIRRAPLAADTLVAVAFKRSERLVAAILAIWKCGAAYVPIDPDYPAARIRQILDTASPLVVLDEAAMHALDAGSRAERDDNLDRRAAAADLAYVIFTSGSTGQPKGAMIEHVGMLNHILAKIEDFHLDAASAIVQNASHCFDISVWQCFAALLAGGRTIVYRDELVLDPAAFLARVRRDRVTLLEVVPSYLAALLDRFEDDPRPFDDLRVLMVTGETVKPSLVERWFRLCPSIPLANAYGPTEASDDITHAILHAPAAMSTVPIGRPVRNFHIYIVDDRMRLCPIGVSGELCVSGPGVGRGYLHDPARTSAAFLEDPFRPERGARMYRTGDIGYFTADGTLLLSGRKDHQVKVRGYRIELGDIEAALTTLDAVRDAAVVSRRDRAGDDPYLAAYVSLRHGSAPAGVEILEQLAARLPEYMVPATCTVLAELPVTPNGKVDRKALPVPDIGMRPAGRAYAPPRTPIEQRLAQIWADVLGVERPGIDDNFFALGGQSILAMQIVSRASREGIELTPRDIFQRQTIAELAREARAVRPRVHAPSRSGPAPLSPAQRQFFADVTIDRHHYNQSILLDVPADFDAERCRRAVDAVVAHHDALRLRFANAGGIWRQSVAATEAADVFSIEDASTLSETAEQLQASLDLTNGPLLRVAFVEGGAARPGLLLIAIHHLAVDGVSWRILLEDLIAAYDDISHGAAVSLPPVATTYLTWADTLAARGSSADLAQDLARWTTPERRSAAPMPTDTPASSATDTVDSGAEIAIVFDEAVTRRFLQAAPDVDVLLAATALTFAEWARQPRLLVDIETHGRDNPFDAMDVTRTVGWFTSTFPALLDVPSDATGVADAARQLTAQAKSVPNGGFSYGLLRHAGTPESEAPLAAMPRAGILLNYHGRVDHDARSGWRVSADAPGAARSHRQHREYLFEINGMVAGGRLRVTLGYGKDLHRDETASALARRLEDRVKAIAGQPAHDRLLPDVRDAEDVYGLSPTQHGMLFHALLDPDGQAYFNQLTCVLTGALDVAAFREAWRVAVARHPALRTSFHWKNVDRPLQAVHATAEIPWRIDDWSAFPDEEQKRRWVADAEADRQRPFDLSTPPLMRCALIRTGRDTHRFRWSQHHLLLDGWSSSIVLNDVLAGYDALSRGKPYTPAAPPLFRDNVAWLQRQDQAEAERFWREHLSGFTTPTPLVLGLPELEGRARPGQFAEAERTIPAPVAARVKALAAANQVTLNTLFQGVWAMLLSRYGGQRDVVFGAITSGRSAALPGSDRMVGLFINTVPVRAHADPDAPVFAMLRQLQRDNADREVYSYSSLADVQRWSPVEGGVPLFETILIFENYPVAASIAAGTHLLDVRQVQAIEPNNYPLTFVVTPGDTIGIKVMFDDGRFDRATIDRLLGHVEMLLEGIEASPDGPIGALPLLTDRERQQIADGNRTQRALPADETVLSLVEAHARATPDRTAVICEGTAVTYGALNARANQLARLLQRSGRIEPDSRIVVLLRRSERLPEAVLALWKCEAAYVPVDPDYPDERIATILANAKPALVIADGRELAPERAAAFGRMAPLILLDGMADARGREAVTDLDGPRDPAALAYVIFTSGSTGVPKGAMLQHRGLLNHVLSMIDELSLGPSSTVAQTASHGFDISMWQLFAAMAAGGTTAIYPETVVLHPAALAARFETDAVTVAQFVPSYLNVFLDALDAAGAARPTFRALTHMVLIGEALKRGTIARWFSLYPAIALMNAYGPTEASDSVAHFDMRRPPAGTAVPLGRPIQNIALYVVDPGMRPCPAGVKGEIMIAGAGVGRGYLFDEARTSAAFVPDPFATTPGARAYKTGDVGCYASDGLLYFFGRRDFQVKVRGHRIELGEIEACLAAIEGVRDAAVIARDSDTGDTTLCAYVAATTGRAHTEASLTLALADHLPRHAVPAVVRVLADLPVMSNGKVDRRALAAMSIDRPEARRRTPPATGTERALARIWCEILQRPEVGVDDSFFDLGGHSLHAIQIVSRAGRDLGVDIGIGDLFERGTIRALAQLIDSRAPAAARAALVAQPAQDDYDTSPMQRGMWLASRTPHGSAAYNMAGAFWLDGAIDVPVLRHALRTLVARHEALRTVFALVGGSLRQIVRADAAGDVLRETDWTSDPSHDDDVQASVRQRATVPFDLARGPLFDAELLRVADRRSLLLVRLHHIVGDAASIRILLGEALALYDAFLAGESDPLPPLPVQYRDFIAWQNARAAEAARDVSRRYWRETLNADMPRCGFSPDRPRPDAGNAVSDIPAAPASGVVATCDVDDTLTRALRVVSARHDTTTFSVVLSAVYAILYRHTGQEDIVVGTTVSHRHDPLLEAQVGCYIDTLPLRAAVSGSDTPSRLIDRTARVCRDALAHQDYPFEALLEDLRVPTPAAKAPLFDVLVDHVPAHAANTSAAARAGLTISEFIFDGEDAHADAMFLIAESDDGSTMAIRLVFDAARFTPEFSGSVRARLLVILQWLAGDGADPLSALDLTDRPRTAARRVRVNLEAK